MAQLPQDSKLIAYALDALCVKRLFQGNTSQRLMLHILSQVDHAKATMANEVENPVGADLRSNILYLEGVCEVLPARGTEHRSTPLPGTTALLGDEVEADYH